MGIEQDIINVVDVALKHSALSMPEMQSFGRFLHFPNRNMDLGKGVEVGHFLTPLPPTTSAAQKRLFTPCSLHPDTS
jgi:hypothetical protein